MTNLEVPSWVSPVFSPDPTVLRSVEEKITPGEWEQETCIYQPIVSGESGTHIHNVIKGLCIFAQKKILEAIESKRKRS